MFCRRGEQKNMLSIEITPDAEQRLQELLRDTESNSVRVKTFTIGPACSLKTLFGVSMDDLGDSDVSTVVNSIQFVADKDFLSQYGESFAISLDENQSLTVTPKPIER